MPVSDGQDVRRPAGDGRKQCASAPLGLLEGPGTISVARRNDFSGGLTMTRIPKIEELMSRELICARRSDTFGTAYQTMLRAGIHHLPVVDEKQQLVGVLSSKEVMEPPTRPRAGLSGPAVCPPTGSHGARADRRTRRNRSHVEERAGRAPRDRQELEVARGGHRDGPPSGIAMDGRPPHRR